MLSPPSIQRLRCPWARYGRCSINGCPLLRVCVHFRWSSYQKTFISFIFKLLKIKRYLFIYIGKKRGFNIKIKTLKKCCLIITLKNKVWIILIVAVLQVKPGLLFWRVAMNTFTVLCDASFTQIESRFSLCVCSKGNHASPSFIHTYRDVPVIWVNAHQITLISGKKYQVNLYKNMIALMDAFQWCLHVTAWRLHKFCQQPEAAAS